jgi:subtilase family serine protease
MRLRTFFWGGSGLVAGLVTVLAAGVVTSSAAVQPATATRSAPATAPAAMKPACGPTKPGFMRCLALYKPQTTVNRALATGAASPAATPAGLSPANIVSAYKLPVSRGSGQTVAVVDAFRTPHLASDLETYRKEYKLPACTTAAGCLKIVNQQGKASPLPVSGVPDGWDVETMLDVSMVSAACPHCKILVVEAADDSDANLAAAEDTAARLGAQVISNSYGERESGETQRYAAAYDHRGHTIVVSSGDIGYTAANFPANLSTVTAVAGTELTRATNSRGWTEQVWNTDAGASGSGCSAYVPKPSWQGDPHCPGRTVADVSAVAWNIPVYDSNEGGWLNVGGTSVAAPLIAGIYALAGNGTKIAPGYGYSHRRSLFDVVTGNNIYAGTSCGGDYLCDAKKGYDAPSGLGTPDGTGAF